MKRSRELAAKLLRKAAQDQFVVEKLLPDPNSPEDLIGFHAQQAVEKTLKAILALAFVPYAHTHDLLELIDLVRTKGFDFPPDLEEVKRLTTFAVGFRYEELQPPFDRAWALDCVRRTRAWAEGILGKS